MLLLIYLIFPQQKCPQRVMVKAVNRRPCRRPVRTVTLKSECKVDGFHFSCFKEPQCPIWCSHRQCKSESRHTLSFFYQEGKLCSNVKPGLGHTGDLPLLCPQRGCGESSPRYLCGQVPSDKELSAASRKLLHCRLPSFNLYK